MSFCFWVNNVFRWILLYPGGDHLLNEFSFLPLDLQRNYLPRYWWDEGEGRQRRVLPLCCYVGSSGCGSEMQGAGNYRPAHQAEGHWWKQVRPEWTRHLQSGTDEKCHLDDVGLGLWEVLASWFICSFFPQEPRHQDQGHSLPSGLWLVLAWRSAVSVRESNSVIYWSLISVQWVVNSFPWGSLIHFRFLFQRTSPPFHQTAPAEREVVVDVVCKLLDFFQNKKSNITFASCLHWSIRWYVYLIAVTRVFSFL